MKTKKGISLVELLTALTLFGFIFFGASALYVTGLKSMTRTMTDTNITQKNAQGTRRVVESIREAISVTISNGGNTLTYTLPKKNAGVDATTGEIEYEVPLVSDGVARSFSVNGSGQLVDDQTGRILVKNISTTDPMPGSSQYNQTYQPFMLTTIGSSRGVTINLITSEAVGTKLRYARMKTTVILRNTL